MKRKTNAAATVEAAAKKTSAEPARLLLLLLERRRYGFCSLQRARHLSSLSASREGEDYRSMTDDAVDTQKTKEKEGEQSKQQLTLLRISAPVSMRKLLLQKKKRC